MIKIQKRQITGYAYKLAKSMMPKISGKCVYVTLWSCCIVYDFMNVI